MHGREEKGGRTDEKKPAERVLDIKPKMKRRFTLGRERGRNMVQKRNPQG